MITSPKTNVAVLPAGCEGVYTIQLENGWVRVALTNLGATICGIYVPGEGGKEVNVVRGYDRVEKYVTDPFYMGSTVGRVAGRISNSRFTINGREFRLPANDGASGNHLHGGVEGFNKKRFDIIETSSDSGEARVVLGYTSADGEEGYPGNLEVRVTYTLTADNELTVAYEAWTDQPTHVNLTNHSYFNLMGDSARTLEQELQINAHQFLQTDEHYIPTGVINSVAGTPYDFTVSHRIGRGKKKLPQPGYNECYVLDKTFDVAAVLCDPASGRKMEVRTSYPALLFYTGDYLQGDFQPCEGVCLEAQFFPDAPNRPEWEGTLLLPGEVYKHYIAYRFYTAAETAG